MVLDMLNLLHRMKSHFGISLRIDVVVDGQKLGLKMKVCLHECTNYEVFDQKSTESAKEAGADSI